jgi:ribA/ribD-fused uncharacterized protein
MQYSGYKVTETESHIFFLTGPLSNWHITPFKGRLTPVGLVHSFNCGEQYLMASKGLLFGDVVRTKAIMEDKRPFMQKDLGRHVADFSIETWNSEAAPVWDEHARPIMFRGCWYKCLYDEEYRNVLLNSGERHIVEASAKDRIWGVGLSWDNPAVLDPANWQGSNWLGETHMLVRTCYRTLLAKPSTNFDPWTMKFT